MLFLKQTGHHRRTVDGICSLGAWILSFPLLILYGLTAWPLHAPTGSTATCSHQHRESRLGETLSRALRDNVFPFDFAIRCYTWITAGRTGRPYRAIRCTILTVGKFEGLVTHINNLANEDLLPGWAWDSSRLTWSNFHNPNNAIALFSSRSGMTAWVRRS